MYSYTITIGRNYSTSTGSELAGQPMSEVSWATLVDGVSEYLGFYLINDEAGALEVHYGKGNWDGVEEESAKVTLLTNNELTEDNLYYLKVRAEAWADDFKQDAIALTIGESMVIEAPARV